MSRDCDEVARVRYARVKERKKQASELITRLGRKLQTERRKEKEEGKSRPSKGMGEAREIRSLSTVRSSPRTRPDQVRSGQCDSMEPGNGWKKKKVLEHVKAKQ